MWCATGFSSGTSFIYFVHTVSHTVICQSGHSYHFFADDSQLHNSSIPSDFPALVNGLKDRIEDVVEWMSDSMLKMNNDKTELLAIGTKSKICQVNPSLTPVSISGHDIPFSQSVKSLGVFVDETLSMDVHIRHLCRILFCQLCRLGKIRSFLSTDATPTPPPKQQQKQQQQQQKNPKKCKKTNKQTNNHKQTNKQKPSTSLFLSYSQD